MTIENIDASQLARALKQCACFNVRSAARAVTNIYDRTLEPAGLRMTQLAILAVIRAHGVRTMQKLAADLGLDPSTMTRTLQPLLDGEWVRVETAQEDARAKQIVLTATGCKKLEQGYRLWHTAQQSLRTQLGPERFDRLVADLAALNKIVK
jgi:DNA-binding MarR family transcriptional regulator